MTTDTIPQRLVNARVIKFLLFMICMTEGGRICAQASHTKGCRLAGVVADTTGTPLPFVTVYLQQTKFATSTSQDGSFQFEDIPPGSYILTIQALGFHTISKNIILSGGFAQSDRFILREKTTDLDEVIIQGLSEPELQRQSANNVAIINTQALGNRTIGTTDILNTMGGIRVRQQGGLGSDVNMSVQGISGKQIKFFLNGMPLDIFGQGMGINAIPLNILDRIEIHKGFVPVEFGGDALGGAVNLVTYSRMNNYLDATYSIGSFNTHNAHVATRYSRKNYHLAATGFYNYSDNNYPVRVAITNQYGNPEPHTVRRFHNAYSNHLVSVEGGIHHKAFADELTLQLNASGFSDDKQHGTTMEVPFGKVNLKEDAYSVTLHYKKNFAEKLDVDLFSAFSYLNRNYTDTSSSIYNWRGEVIGKSQFGGEASYSGNLLTLHTKNSVYRINLSYHINGQTAIKLNYFSSLMDRSGHDPVAAIYYKKDIFANPTNLHKNIGAVSIEHGFLADRLSSISFIKFFHYRSTGSNLVSEATSLSNTVNRLGYGQAFRYKFSEAGSIKFSYEHASRLPDETELFGLGNIVLPNPTLNPEHSHNINATGSIKNKSKRFSLETNLFYRIVDDIIYQRLITPTSSQYQNLMKVQVAGIEMTTDYKILRTLSITANATYQDLRNRKVSGDLTQRYVGAQLPNIPFLFGSAGIKFEKSSLLNSHDKFEAWWGLRYVHWFYLYWSIDGRKDTKHIIPDQWAQNAGLSYHIKKDKLVATVDVNNLLDQRLYDNYNVQKPGRSCSFKVRFFLSNKN